MTATKQRIVLIGLVLFTLWPIVQIGWVEHYGLSAWKLMGWGMYATPRPSYSGITVSGRRAGATQLEPVNPLPPAWIEEARGFLERQRWLGRLTTPSSLAASFAKLRPEFVEIRITIYTPVIDPKTGMVVQRETPYDYPLPAGE